MVYSITCCHRVDLQHGWNGWKEQCKWGNRGNGHHFFAIFSAVQHYHLMISAYRGSDEAASASPSPSHPNNACIRLWVIAQSLSACLISLIVPQLNLTSIEKKKKSQINKSIPLSSSGLVWHVFIAHIR